MIFYLVLPNFGLWVLESFVCMLDSFAQNKKLCHMWFGIGWSLTFFIGFSNIKSYFYCWLVQLLFIVPADNTTPISHYWTFAAVWAFIPAPLRALFKKICLFLTIAKNYFYAIRNSLIMKKFKDGVFFLFQVQYLLQARVKPAVLAVVHARPLIPQTDTVSVVIRPHQCITL